ncbi:MAG: OmpA family protein [Enterobacterales bacterium]|nr:OmpA family protein [Enterobacterales bacterium]
MKSRILLAVALIVGTFGVLADKKDRSGFEVGLGLAQYNYNYFDEATTGIVSFGYHYNNTWGVELLHGRPDTESNGTGDYDVDLGILRGLYHLKDEGSWTPYISAGVGAMDVITGETDLVVGVGLKAFDTSNLNFRVETNYHTGDDDTSVMVMLGYRFGESTPMKAEPKDGDMDGVMDNLDACPKTPVGKAVDDRGCMIVEKPMVETDTDGDGVFDKMDKCPDTTAGALVDDMGCQKELAKQVSVDLAINFATNSDVVSADYDAQVAKVADFMKQYAGTSVVIEGHTDSVGRADYNQSLSEKRAASVAAALANRFGVDASRITSVGYGESKPVESNETAEGRSANRRVVAVISETVSEKQWQK